MLEGTFNQSRSRWHSLWLWNLREPTFDALNYTPPPPSLCPALTYRPDYEVPTLLTCQHNYPIFVQIYKQPAAAWQVCDSVTCHECVMRPISDCPHWLLAPGEGTLLMETLVTETTVPESHSLGAIIWILLDFCKTISQRYWHSPFKYMDIRYSNLTVLQKIFSSALVDI